MDAATFKQKLDEMKAVSKAQRRVAGAALDFKRHGGPSFPAAEKMADGMTEKQLRDMAGVKEKGLPGHVKKGKRVHKAYDEGVSRGPRPSLWTDQGRVKSFADWAAELESGALPQYDEADASENPGQGDYDNDGGDDDSMMPNGLSRDDALVVALQELGLHTASELDPEKDRDTIAAAMPVKLDLVRQKLEGSSRLQDMGRSNPLVQRVLADKNATVQDLVIAMSTDDDDRSDDRGPRADQSSMGDQEDGGADADVERDPFTPL